MPVEVEQSLTLETQRTKRKGKERKAELFLNGTQTQRLRYDNVKQDRR